MIVIDTNVVAYHLLRTEPFAGRIDRLVEQDPDWIAPFLLRSELRNLLAVYHRERTLSLQEAKTLIEQAEALFEHSLFEVTSEAILDFVARSSLSAYDCEYVALAHRVDAPLATYDGDILDCFPTVARTPSDILDS